MWQFLYVYNILLDGYSIKPKRKKIFKMVKTLLVFTELLVAILVFGNNDNGNNNVEM